MPKLVGLLLAISLVAACRQGPEATSPDMGPILAVRCGALIDGLADKALAARLILISGERITAILPGDAAPPSNAKLVNLSDHTCLPGLIDTHVHIDGLPQDAENYGIFLQRTPQQTHQLAEKVAETILLSGFTTIRHVGAYFAWLDRDIRDRIEAGEIRGPRMRISGPYLTIPHGGGDMYIPGVEDSEIPDYYRMGVARGPDEFRARAQEVVAGGADFIKVIASGAVFGHGGIPGAPEMTREEITAVVEVAHAAGIKVTAHAHGAQSIKDAILAGVDSIEHASLGDDESLALAVEHDVAFSMDVYNGTYTEDIGREHGYAEEFMRKNTETTEAQRTLFEKAVNRGVTILFGTDLGVLPHDMGARQFEVMVARGMTPMNAIKSATSVAAAHMEIADDVGAIEVGRYGDIIAVAGDPLADLALLQNVPVVIKGGETIKIEVAAARKQADAVYHSGRIYTVNPEQPWAQALAIRDGRIVFVGSDDAVRSYIGPDTIVRDLRRRLMLPAFQDSHIHPVYGALEVLACDLSAQKDIAGYRAKISECAEKNPDEGWLTGGAWSMAAFGPGARASKLILDELVPDRPTYLRSADGHTGWANSRALEIAGINKNTPDPADGIIDRDPDSGEIVGSLQEGAMKLVEKHIPPPDLATRIEALEFARDMLHSYGITSLQEAYAYEQDLETYAALERSGELKLRVIAALLWDNSKTEEQIPALVEHRRKYSMGNIRPTSVKIFVDGVMENYTAVMLEPYLVQGGTRGIPMIDPESMKEVVSLLDAEGFQVHFHALGDGAVRYALDAVEQAVDQNGESDRRHHLSHLEVIHPDDIPRFAELGAVANFQPAWAYADEYIVNLTLPFIEGEVAEWLYPIKSVVDAGGKVAFGSDWNVSTANPMLQIETALTRVDPETHDTDVLNPEQRITLQQAIEAFTINAAFVNHLDASTGTIEKGKLADLIVIDRNLFEIEPTEISEAKVVLTLFAGEPVYEAPAAL